MGIPGKKMNARVGKDGGIKVKDVRVKGKGVVENFELKSVERILKPNNSGIKVASKKNFIEG